MEVRGEVQNVFLRGENAVHLLLAHGAERPLRGAPSSGARHAEGVIAAEDALRGNIVFQTDGACVVHVLLASRRDHVLPTQGGEKERMCRQVNGGTLQAEQSGQRARTIHILNGTTTSRKRAWKCRQGRTSMKR